ncbi:flagellar biosynthesis protein FlhB [Fodinicurvata sp. EGI_FJ10296]|uniref:flagellar biosynthesis protein FlhB n=1 Tax=Fodinicurvata sp. EGI_FJ10296 TaxID=3231908 RepID=UPI0034530D5E
MAEEQDEASKTEEPTPKKLEDAKKKGQVAQSQEVKHFFVLFGGLLFILIFGPSVAGQLTSRFGTHIENVHHIPLDPSALGNLFRAIMGDVLLILMVPTIIIMVCALLGGLVQNGLMFAPESIKPKASKISPLQGAKRLFSSKALFEFGKGILKLGIVSLIGFLVLWPDLQSLELFAGLPVPTFMDRLWNLSVTLMITVVSVVAIIAGLDWAFQVQQYNKQQRMTKQEVKDEQKQTDGDPHVKQRLRQIRSERSRHRMMASVPTADVVVTNPTHYAVAMRYEADAMGAPRVVAKGADHVAQKIREVAREHDIEIVENPPLARALYASVEIDQEIPPDQYKAVAEVISYVFKLRNRNVPPSGTASS